LRNARGCAYFRRYFGATGHAMIRFAGAICLAVGVWALAPKPALAQDAPSDRCFPWQEFRNGVCVAKQTLPAPPPLPAPPAPVPPQLNEPAPAQQNCPAATHADPGSGACVADQAPALPPPSPRIPTVIACAGGTVADGKCTCPAGFRLTPLTGDPAEGGTCLRTDADNCLGGEMTVAGQCLCNGQVTMSGQVYDLEYTKGKCVPKRCPRDAPCAADTPAPPRLSSQEPERRHGCGRGMIATRSGCVPARPRYHTIEPGDYLRMYRAPGVQN
jgi:hypothetical protein